MGQHLEVFHPYNYFNLFQIQPVPVMLFFQCHQILLQYQLHLLLLLGQIPINWQPQHLF